GFPVSTQSWVALIDALPTLTAKKNLARLPKKLPIYLLAGDRDPVGAMGAGPRNLAECYRDAGLTNVELKLYPGGRHEMLNETNRDEVTNDLVAWLDRVLARRGSAPLA